MKFGWDINTVANLNIGGTSRLFSNQPKLSKDFLLTLVCPGSEKFVYNVALFKKLN